MEKEYYLYTFESSHGAISTEKILKPLGCVMMPVPRALSASCGMSVKISPENFSESTKLFKEKTDLEIDEYHVFFIKENRSSGIFNYTPVNLHFK